jgi:hypothetical protein
MSPLFDRLLKHERQYVLQYAADPAVSAPSILPRVAEMWDWEGYQGSQGLGPEQLAKIVTSRALWHPGWTEDQVLTLLRFENESGALNQDLGFVRRLVHDDPAELALGVALGARLAWVQRRHEEQMGMGTQDDDPCLALGALPVMDLELIRRVVDAPNREQDGQRHLLYGAVTAAFHRDLEALRPVVERFNKQKVYPDFEGMRSVLTGIARDDPAQVTAGLNGILEFENRMRKRKEGRIVSMEAHQFYRLAERVSPGLVAGFDTTQPLPWDAGFHAWTRDHPDPLAGCDFRDISPVLHDALIHLKLPSWFRAIEQPELAQDPCRLVITDMGPNAAQVREMVAQWRRIRQWPVPDWGSTPVTVAPDVPRANAAQMSRSLREVGASSRFEKVDP